jgi:anti-sigma regulatory factor (Ser/Thr protein kinase)
MTSAELVLRLWPVPTSCAKARGAVREFCADRHLDRLCDDAELLTSELVTNAVREATSLVTLLAVHQDDDLVVTVSDDGAGLHELVVRLPDPASEHGRGIFVLDAIADDWGSRQHHDGKTVWFRLS